MRFLLIRTSALGDIVHSLPVLTALRRKWPEAEIGWVVEEIFAPLLEGHPDLNQVLPVALRRWRRSPSRPETRRELRTALGAIRSFRADVVLELMGNHKGGVLARWSGARRRIGLDRNLRREPSSALWVNETVKTERVHAIDRAHSLLSALGLEDEPVEFDGDKICPSQGPEPSPLAPSATSTTAPLLFLPGAGWGSKTYPASLWGEVAARVVEKRDVPIEIPLSPSPEERAAAKEIVKSSRGAARCVEAGPLPTLVSRLRGARLVVGGDTGPLHLAQALGTEVLAVMGPTDPHRHGPYGQPERAIFRTLPCSFCYRRFATAKACLLSIPPAEIAARIEDILSTSAT